MASTPRFRNKQPTDVWSIRERLCLASSVLRSGDQNWVSVSRAIRPFGESNRPPDWFSQKNCALQYSELLEKVETPKRKRGERGDAIDTPGDMIVRRLTQDRIEELKKVINDSQQRHKKFKRELEMVRCGQLDEKLDDLWRGIQDEIRAKEIADHEHSKWVQEREQRNAQVARLAPKGILQTSPGKNKRQRHLLELRRNSSEHSEQDSPLSEPLSVEVEELSSPSISGVTTTSLGEMVPGLPTTSTSPLLTSLLKSPSQTTAPTQQISRGLNPAAGEIPSPTGGLPVSRLGPFFNPSSALATAAARQLAVACTDASVLFPPNDASTISSPIKLERNAFTTSVTSSAPTLSRLLELPPSMPGKLPPLPVVEPTPLPPPPPPPPLPPPPPPAPVTTSIVSHLSAHPQTIHQECNLPVEVRGKVPLIDPEDSDLLVGGVEGEDDSDLSRLVQLDQDPSALDMDMEAIVNEIMKEDLNVEDNDDSQMTLNTPPSAPSHILEDISQEGIPIAVKVEEPQVQVFSEKVPESPVVVQPPPITILVEKVHIPDERDLQMAANSSALTPAVPEKLLEESVVAIKESEVSSFPPLECTQETAEQSSKGLDDAVPTPSIQDTLHSKDSSQKEITTPTKTTDSGKHVQSRPKKSSPTETVQQQESKPEPVEVEEYMEDIEEESTNPSQEEESSSLPDDETKEGPVGSEDSREAEEEGLPSEMLMPPSGEEEKEQALEEESMGSVDSKIPKAPSSVSDSIPNSPVSTPQSDDQESLRDYKVWKKAIMLVWRAAANHKYANVFLHPVTNDMAPGYHSIVYRPMDLSTIKKNIESGAIKTTLEFQRDLMLMFQNAIMYNSSDHDVFQMAVLMQKEVMEVVQDFVATQMMVQATETKVLRGRESRTKEGPVPASVQPLRTDSESKEEETKKKRQSLAEMELKLKKRRPKQDE